MNYRQLKNIIFSACLFFILAGYGSLYPAGAEEKLKELERRQFETEKKLREKERLSIERAKTEREKEDKVVQPSEDENRFIINKIILQNDELLTSREKRELTAPYLNKKINYNDLTILVRSITNILIDKGYITARVKISLGQNIKSGVIVLTIINGYISDIVPANYTWRDTLQVFTAFPFLQGEYLNIEDLDYGIEQMNRLKSNNATMKIIPGEELGASQVVIENDSRSRLGIETGIDNLGQRATGEYRGKVSVNIDDLFSINDNIFFDHTRSVNSDTDKKYNRSYTMFFSFPFGYWSFSSSYSRSEYMQYIDGMNRDFRTSGEDINKTAGIERMLGRYKYNRLKLRTSLILKEKVNYIEDARIDSSSRKLSIAKLGLDYSTFLFGGYFSAAPFYSRGLSQFDAYKDDHNLPDDAPKAQFEKYEMSLLWNKSFMVFNQNLGYVLNFTGQFGKDTLYSSEKITIGDMYSVRGFKDNSINGDRGFYLRNEISIFDFSYLWQNLKGARFFVSYDYGYAVEKAGKEANYNTGESSVMGCSAGFAYNSDVLNLNLSYSRRLFEPWFISEDDHVFYCVATFSLTEAAYGISDMLRGKQKIKN